MKHRNKLSQLTLSNNIHSDVATHDVPNIQTYLPFLQFNLTNITKRKQQHIYEYIILNCKQSSALTNSMMLSFSPPIPTASIGLCSCKHIIHHNN